MDCSDGTMITNMGRNESCHACDLEAIAAVCKTARARDRVAVHLIMLRQDLRSLILLNNLIYDNLLGFVRVEEKYSKQNP